MLHIYGSNAEIHVGDLSCNDIVIEGFIEDLDLMFSKARVFVAPLLSGAGLKGKVIEAMSRGVPSVLSPIAAEGTHQTDGMNCEIATTPEEWATAIVALYTDEKKWNRMSEEALKLARTRYSFERAVREFRKPLHYLGLFTPRQNRALVSKN